MTMSEVLLHPFSGKARYAILASGSKGNCALLQTRSTTVLVDAGIGIKDLAGRLAYYGVSLDMIDAVFITHDHSDHIKACEALGRYGIPVICNADTARAIAKSAKFRPVFKLFVTGTSFKYKEFKVSTFTVQHDTFDPVGYAFTVEDKTLVFCTDLGIVTPHIRHILLDASYIVLEANHEVELVHSSNRSHVYKQRVLSRQGHLSNVDACLLLSSLQSSVSHVTLAHLSDECNCPVVLMKQARDSLSAAIPLEYAKQNEVSAPVVIQ